MKDFSYAYQFNEIPSGKSDQYYNYLLTIIDSEEFYNELRQDNGRHAQTIAKLKNSNGNTLLHVVPNVRFAKILLDFGADIDAQNYLGNTPLHTN